MMVERSALIRLYAPEDYKDALLAIEDAVDDSKLKYDAALVTLSEDQIWYDEWVADVSQYLIGDDDSWLAQSMYPQPDEIIYYSEKNLEWRLEALMENKVELPKCLEYFKFGLDVSQLL